MNPRWPIFIPSKGRAETRLTVRMFEKNETPYTVFVEPQEAEAYAAVIPPGRIHILPHRDKGVTVTRNYMWDFAEREGFDKYWSFDDNIAGLFRFNHNLKTPCADSTILAVIEDFVDRYENIAVAGCQYFMFVLRKYWCPPYTLNTRVYSNMLLETGLRDKAGDKIRFKTFFNEDTELCLNILKNGFATVLFNAFLIEKQTTMTMSGGNTEYYKETQKRLEFVEELRRAHPDLVKLTEKFGRYHHQVDYSKFKQPLRRKPGVVVPRGVNNFGMVLEERVPGTEEWQCEAFEEEEAVG